MTDSTQAQEQGLPLEFLNLPAAFVQSLDEEDPKIESPVCVVGHAREEPPYYYKGIDGQSFIGSNN